MRDKAMASAASIWRERDSETPSFLESTVLGLVVAYLVLNRMIPDRFILPIGQSIRPYELILALVLGAWLVWMVVDPHPFPGGVLGFIALATLIVLGIAPYLHGLTMTRYQANGAERGLFRLFLFSGLFLSSFHLAFRVRAGRLLLGWVVGATTIQAIFSIREFVVKQPVELFDTLATGIGLIPDPNSIRLELDSVFLRLTGEVRAVATAPHPIVLSAVITLGILIVSSWLIVSESPNQRRWLGLSSLVLILALPLTNSRTGFVILAVAALPMLILMIRDSTKILPAILGGFAIMAAAFVISPQTPRLLLNSFTNPGNDPNTQVRIERFSRIPELLDDRPWVGAGYLTHDPKIQIFDNAYNLGLIEFGIVGLTLVVLLFFIILVRCWGVVSKARRDEAILPIAGVAAAIAILAGGVTFDAWTFDQFLPTALIVMGLGAGRAAVIFRREASLSAELKSTWSA